MKEKINKNKIQAEEGDKGYKTIILDTDRGNIACRYYKVENTNSGAIYVGGIGGGFDTPADELYPYLSEKLKLEDISSLRIRFRDSKSLEEAVYDVIAGIKFLESE